MKLRALSEGFEDFFDSDLPTTVDVGEPQSSEFILELYRGFTVDVEALDRRGEGFLLSPKRSEQGLIWFTHRFINGHDPIEYVQGRGNCILTYPLKCIRHTQTLYMSDGSERIRIPDRILQLSEPTQNSRFYMGIELPQGWVFTYKYEKFVGCSVDLVVTKDMLSF